MTLKEFGESVLGLCMLVAIGVVISKCSGNSPSGDRAANKVSEQALAASKDPVEIAKSLLGAATNPTASRNEKLLVINYKLKDNLTASWMLTGYHLDIIKLVPTLFKQVPGIEEVQLRATTKLTDLRGHENEVMVAKAGFSRGNSEGTNWPNVMPDNIPRIADTYWVHRAMTE